MRGGMKIIACRSEALSSLVISIDDRVKHDGDDV